MQSLKSEKGRLVDYVKLYCESSEDVSLAGSDIVTANQSEKQHQDNTQLQMQQQKLDHKVKMVTAKNPAPVMGGGTSQASARKTITSRKTIHGKSTVSKPALSKLKGK